MTLSSRGVQWLSQIEKGGRALVGVFGFAAPRKRRVGGRPSEKILQACLKQVPKKRQRQFKPFV